MVSAQTESQISSVVPSTNTPPQEHRLQPMLALESAVLKKATGFVLVFAFSKEHGSWLTMTKDLFAC